MAIIKVKIKVLFVFFCFVLFFKSHKVGFYSFVQQHQCIQYINLNLQEPDQETYIKADEFFFYLSYRYIYTSSLIVFYVKDFIVLHSLGLINDSKSVLTLHLSLFQPKKL